MSINGDTDGIRCCCGDGGGWTAATDENNEIIDNNEINIDVRFEQTVDCDKNDNSRQIRRLCRNANVDSK